MYNALLLTRAIRYHNKFVSFSLRLHPGRVTFLIIYYSRKIGFTPPTRNQYAYTIRAYLLFVAESRTFNISFLLFLSEDEKTSLSALQRSTNVSRNVEDAHPPGQPGREWSSYRTDGRKFVFGPKDVRVLFTIYTAGTRIAKALGSE